MFNLVFRYKKAVLVLSVMLLILGFKFDSKPKITVQITNVKSDKGQVLLSAYNKEAQYTDHPFTFFKIPKDEIQSGKVVYTIDELPPGKYVFTLLDDKNSNEAMDYSWIGLPQEGYGFSNNKKPSISGAPDFSECILDIFEDTTIEIKMQYWND